jgi:hypothetical protein
VLGDSFELLSDAARNMFLDTVSVLANRSADLALAVWQARWLGADLEFANLQDAGLVGSVGGALVVHDVIKALGRAILGDSKRPEVYGTRLWADRDSRRLVEFPQVCLVLAGWGVEFQQQFPLPLSRA